MRILFLQDAGYFSWAAGVKVNRSLAHWLARCGHEIEAVVSLDGPRGMNDDLLHGAGCRVDEVNGRYLRLDDNGTRVTAYHLVQDYNDSLEAAVLESQADIFVFSESCTYRRLEAIPGSVRERCIVTVHCVEVLPFGPFAVLPDPVAAELLHQTGGVISVCDFLKQYLTDFGGIEASVMRFPAYGQGPFRDLSGSNDGLVLMVNASAIKGLPILLELARLFPSTAFGAVRSWATSESDLLVMAGEHNVEVVEPDPNIENILEKTRILLAPSLWQEAFPATVIQAMLRGIPVIASQVGGLREAKLGTRYVLLVNEIKDWKPVLLPSGIQMCPIVPEQDVTPWREALRRLLQDRRHFMDLSRESRRAAHEFLSQVRVDPFEEFFFKVLQGVSGKGIKQASD